MYRFNYDICNRKLTWFLAQATASLLSIEGQLVSLALKLVDDPHYVGETPLQDTTASSNPSGDIPTNSSTTDQRDLTDVNPS